MFVRRRELILVVALAAFAAIRVAVFIALPIFGPTDERQHFDNVIRYSQGEIPRAIGPHTREVDEWTPVFIDPGYWFDPQVSPIPRSEIEANNARAIRAVLEGVIPSPPNHENLEPPLYYFVAGAWLRFGEGLGLRNVELVYWVRGLNILIVFALVLVGYAAAAAAFPDNATVRMGTAALLATWPQDALYAVNSDALVPLCAGVAFLGIAKWSSGQWKPVTSAMIVGASLAATLLTKNSAAPVVVVMSLAAFCLAMRHWRAFIPLAAWAAVLGAWLAWNKTTIGYWTGTTPKFELLKFTPKPMRHWGESPLWTWRGGRAFWSELIAKFWRGEMIWHSRQIASVPMDRLYLFATVWGTLGAAIKLLKTQNVAQWTLVSIGAWGFLASVFYLVVATVTLDFGPMGTPSPYYAFPGFVCGRLMDGVMVPFAVMFAYGLTALRWRWLTDSVLIAYCVAMMASEIWLHVPIFREIW